MISIPEKFSAQAIGKGNVTRRIDVIAAMITMNGTLEQLKELELCYSPVFGTAKDVVNMAALVGLNLLNGRIRQVRVSDVRGREDADDWVRSNVPYDVVPRIESNSIDVCLSLVSLGIGWAILPEICLDNYTGFKVPLFHPDGSPIVRETSLCYRDSDLAQPHIRVFIDFMKKYQYKTV